MGVAAESRFKEKSLRDFHINDRPTEFAVMDRLNALCKRSVAAHFISPTKMLAVPDPQKQGWWLHDQEIWERDGWGAYALFYPTLRDLVQDNHLEIVGYDSPNNQWMLQSTPMSVKVETR